MGTRKKEIRCSRCKKQVQVDLFYPYRTCISCREQVKRYRKRRKAEERREADPDQPTLRKVLSESPELDNIPMKDEKCFVFRSMCIGEQEKNRWFFAMHHQNCRLCARFHTIMKDYMPRGFNLW